MGSPASSGNCGRSRAHSSDRLERRRRWSPRQRAGRRQTGRAHAPPSPSREKPEDGGERSSLANEGAPSAGCCASPHAASEEAGRLLLLLLLLPLVLVLVLLLLLLLLLLPLVLVLVLLLLLLLLVLPLVGEASASASAARDGDGEREGGREGGEACAARALSLRRRLP